MHDIFHKFKCWEGVVEAGFTTDFLGVLERESFFYFGNPDRKPRHTRRRTVTTELPSFNDEYFEWIDVLEAVAAAKQKFTMMELGAGYGRWLVRAEAALKTYNSAFPCELIGVEAEPIHFEYMITHFRDNGIDPSRHRLINGCCTDNDGRAWFYIGDPDQWYGQEIMVGPEFGPLWSPHGIHSMYVLVKKLCVGQRIKRVPTVSLKTLLQPLAQVDLIDLDVQGLELSILSAATQELDRKVKRVHIGTHGAKIEAGLRKLFCDLGWKNIHDYSSRSDLPTQWGLIRLEDGVQSWLNPKLQ